MDICAPASACARCLPHMSRGCTPADHIYGASACHRTNIATTRRSAHAPRQKRRGTSCAIFASGLNPLLVHGFVDGKCAPNN